MKNYDNVLNKLDQLNTEYTFYGKYAEPGYMLDTDKIGILTGDWNKISNQLESALELHFELEWLDEWAACDDCGGLVRTSPNSYDWLPSYIMFDGYILCESCIRHNLEEHIQDYLNQHDKASTILNHDDLIKHGFDQLNGTYESGMHSHQTDTPEKALQQFHNQLKDKDYIFIIPSTGQFDVQFELWARPTNYQHDE